MKKQTRKYKLYLEIRSRYQLKKIFRDKSFRAANVRRSSSYVQSLLQVKRTYDEKNKEPEKEVLKAKPKNEFSIIDNPKNVLGFIHLLKSYAKPRYSGNKINIDLSEVSNIDIGAISILLSTVKELSYYKIHVTSDIPTKGDCRKIFTESGFIPHMKSLTAGSFSNFTYTSTEKNLILMKGKDKTRNKEVGETIKQAMDMLTGTPAHYQPIFSIIQEINGNSIEHAYGTLKKEHWLLAINHDKQNNKVIFTFADNGVGILQTLRRKLTQEFFEKLKLYNDADILSGAFTKKYTSRHEFQINRNKGLPLLRKIQSENNEVKNLFVISNKVFLYIDTYKSIDIDRAFRGTFYYWELDIDCIQRWKLRTTK